MKNNIYYFKLINKCIVILVLVSNISLFSQSNGGGYSNSYLLRNVGARAIGMSGAFTAISNDPLSVFYNPAGLSDLNFSPTFNGMYSLLDIGRSHNTLFYGQKLNDNYSIGAGINIYGSGDFTMRDQRGVAIKNISSTDYALSVSGAYNLEFASLGATFKYISNSLYGISGSMNGYAVDIGSKFNIMNLFTFGLTLQNIFSNASYDDGIKEQSKIPYSIRAGIGFEIPFDNSYSEGTRNTITGEKEVLNYHTNRYIAFDLDVHYYQYTKYPSILIGTEFSPHSIIAFRAGMEIFGNNNGEAKILPLNTWGAGVAIKPFINTISIPISFEYSLGSDYISYQKLSHHISINIEF